MTVDGLSASARTRLLAFLEAAVPKMEHALAENEQSDTFDDDARSADRRAVRGRHRRTPGARVRARAGPGGLRARGKPTSGSSRDERFWRDLVPTGLSWNRSGYSIAVSYGRFDVTGWCDSPGRAVRLEPEAKRVDPLKPDSIFETDSCLQCVAWHPVDPAVVAAGSFDGEVHVWDVRGDADGDGDGDGDGKENVLGKRSRERIRRAVFADAVSDRRRTAARGFRRVAPERARRGDARGPRRDADARRVLVRVGRTRPGLGLFQSRITREDAEDRANDRKRIRRVPAFPFPSFRYETRPPADAGRERGFVRGIAAASFIPTARASGDPSSANTANACDCVDYEAPFNAHVVAAGGRPSSTSSFLLGCDGGAVLECLMRHGAEAGAAAFARECAAGSVPAMRSPATAEYEPHRRARGVSRRTRASQACF